MAPPPAALHCFSTSQRPPWRPRRRAPGEEFSRDGFSLTELLVVIGIIALLVGILLVALGKVQVRAKQTQTENSMRQFLNACTAFQTENGRYPGVIPEVVLADPLNFTAGMPFLSSTENALLDLLGGFRVLQPTDDTTPDSAAELDFAAYSGTAYPVGPSGWQIKIDAVRIGEGPVINGKPRAPYFTPGASELARAAYPPANANTPSDIVPDLVDSWGQPILYLRQLRERGPLVGDFASAPAPQFLRAGVRPYVESTGLGELANDQTTVNANRASILNSAPDPNATLARILLHPAIDNQAKGSICLISAGPDGIYFSRADGPGSEGTGVDDIVTNAQTEYNNPKVVDDYDDVRMFGGA